MSFESDFSESTAPDVYQLRVTVSNALEGQNLGSAQAHHVLPGASIRANPLVRDWMLSLEANGLYKHNDISNALIMPTTDNGSIATGIAKHYGSHLGAPTGATDGYNKYVADGLKAIREQWLVHQDDALAAKQITGFQNHLRAGLTAGFGVGDKWVRPELALQSTDPLFAADGASPRGEDFNWERLTKDPWYQQGVFGSGQSNWADPAFDIFSDGKIIDAETRARLRISVDKLDVTKAGYIAAMEDALKAAEAQNTGSHLPSNSAGNKLHFAQNAGDKFTILAMMVTFGAVMQAAFSTPAAAEATKAEIQKHLNPEALENGAWVLTEGLFNEQLKYAAARIAAGPVGTVALTALDAYGAARGAIKALKAAYPDVPLWGAIDTVLDQFEAELKKAGQSIAQAVVQALGFTDLVSVDGIEAPGGLMEALGGDGSQLMWVTGKAKVDGQDGNDWIIHLGEGEMIGGAGDDKLVSWGAKKDGNATGMTMSGGDGDDILISLFGDGSYMYGGDGGDIFISWSGEDHMFGNDGIEASDNEEDWYFISNNTFIHNAGVEDHVFLGPFVAHGGVKTWWMEGQFAYNMPFHGYFSAMPTVALPAMAALAPLMAVSARVDVFSSLMFRYAVSTTHQLVIQSFLGAGQAVVEGYELDLETGIGTAGITVYQQHLVEGFTLAEVRKTLNLALKAGFGVGLDGEDPLILDLDGDGYDLVRRDAAGVYFDLDGDSFAERTAWVAPDDGFLVRDLNGNGQIDDITEMFGTAATPGLTMLAALDSNGDDRITSADTDFATLKVWRDLDGVASKYLPNYLGWRRAIERDHGRLTPHHMLAEAIG
ncbi:MAG: AHH domain-containing protein [Hyphomicrobiaceae bacterium]|nr:AHH domain-containing protein [Hyphomicrobiaceae bacterium]MCC0009710.1 AHH domain-containing protein [Hyphomicrobiaceae bacterium]